MINLEYLSASEIGELVNSKKITPTEVIDYFKDRINRLNPKLNALTYLNFEEAYIEAKKLEKRLEKGENCGPFAGVPYVLKDFLPSKKGWYHTFGGVKSITRLDEEDSIFNLAMKEAGGIAIGKSNAPSFGFRGTTDNNAFGPTRNPFNLKYNAGGSSGGTASAIASGLVPIGEGGDAGGSIRIPSSWCNSFGYKASIGTIPSVNRPDAYSATHPYCFNGGLTKTVTDSAILLSYMAKYNHLDPLSYPRKDIDYLSKMNKPISDMKIAYTLDFDIFDTDEEIKEKILESINKIKPLVKQIDLVHFNIKRTANELAELWCESISIDTSIELEQFKKEGLDITELPKEFIRYNKKASKWGIKEFNNFNLTRTELYDAFEDVLSKYDLILSPVTLINPVLNKRGGRTLGPSTINDKKVNPIIGFSETFLVNFTGHPAASIPAGLSKNGLPIGLHIIGKRFNDVDVLRFSYQYEKISPWRDNYKLIKL